MIEPSTVVEHRTQEGLGVRPVRPDIDVDRVAAAIQPVYRGPVASRRRMSERKPF